MLVISVLHCLSQVPAHAFRGYALLAMFMQSPLMTVTDQLQRKFFEPYGYRTAGNTVFWCIFCIFGQPLIVLLCYWDFYCRREGIE